MAPYSFEPLSAAAHEIRLLILKPGEGESVLDIEIIYASLDDPPSYEAISYVWGDPAVTIPIRLFNPVRNGPDDETRHVAFQVTTNLEAALRHLRYPDRTRILWADAICINQEDGIEKGHQIRNMDQVYAKASRVCIWLGIEADESDYAMNLLNYCEEYLDKDTEALFHSELHSEPKWVRPWRAFTHLVSRAWFNRCWVMQEVGMARDRLVCCGQRSSTWNSLYAASILLFTETSMFLLKSEDASRYGSFPIGLFFQDWNFSIEQRLKWLEGISHIIGMHTILTQLASSGRMSMSNLLRLCHDRAVTQPPDCVYALLSMAKETIRKTWAIDYCEDINIIFRDCVVNVVQATGVLDIICGSSGVGEHEHQPSWLPRFYGRFQQCNCRAYNYDTITEGSYPVSSNTSSMSRKVNTDFSPYQAAADTRANVTFDEMRLTVTGFHIDNLYEFFHQPSLVNMTQFSLPQQWKDTFLFLQDGNLQIDENTLDSFIRTLVADRSFWGKIIPQEESGDINDKVTQMRNLRLELVREWSDKCIELFENDTVVTPYGSSDFMAAVNKFLTDRQFIITAENVFMALVPESAKRGDIVCILLGCSVPVVLRPVQRRSRDGDHDDHGDGLQSKEDQEKEYYFVGEAYVHGIMDGEAMERLGAGEFELEEFCMI